MFPRELEHIQTGIRAIAVEKNGRDLTFDDGSVDSGDNWRVPYPPHDEVRTVH